jgi:hypothetical protein
VLQFWWINLISWADALAPSVSGLFKWRQGNTQIPTNHQKDDFRFELPPLEQTGNR